MKMPTVWGHEDELGRSGPARHSSCSSAMAVRKWGIETVCLLAGDLTSAKETFPFTSASALEHTQCLSG